MLISRLPLPRPLTGWLRAALVGALASAPFSCLATQFSDSGALLSARHYVNGVNTTGLKLRDDGTTRKVGFVQFRVDGLRARNEALPYPHTLFRRVTKAELKLTLTAAASGKDIEVWATDNTGPATAPATTGTQYVARKASLDSALLQVFDVTKYITGEGIFAFYLKTASDSDISINATPVLSLTVNDGQDTGGAIDVSALDYKNIGIEVRARYGDSVDITDAGIIDVTKQPYNATGGDTSDDTLAIQRAVNDAQAARLAVFFPAGTYTISDTINCETPHIPDMYLNPGEDGSANDDEFHSRQDFPSVLRGVGPTSIIKLEPGANFGNAAKPKPALYFWSRQKDAAKAHLNIHASNFNHTLMNVKVDVSAGTNDGAVAVSMPGSQGIRLSEVVINASGAYAGVMGLPSAGGFIHDVDITGGQYGFYADTSSTSESHAAYTTVINYSTTSGQSQYGIMYGGGCSLTVVGSKIQNSKGIKMDAGLRAWNGSLSMIDSYITLSSAADTAAIVSTRNVYLRNVYVNRTAKPAITNIVHLDADDASATTLSFAGNISLVEEFAGAVTIDQAPFHTGGATIVPIFVKANDVAMARLPAGQKTWQIAAPTSVAAPLDAVFNKHDWIDTPHFRAGDVYNVGVGSNAINAQDTADDFTKLQGAIDAGHEKIFLPAGTYYISQPLKLKYNTKIFGISKSYTIIKPMWNSFNGTIQPLIETTADINHAPLIADLQLRTRISTVSDTKAYQLLWKAGKGVVKDLLFDRRQMGASKGTGQAHPMTRIDSPGGGKWYGFWINRDFALDGYRSMRIAGATTGLAFYMFNPEYATVTGQVEITGCQNIDFYGTKTEGNWLNFLINNSSKFRIYGLGGNASPWPADKKESNSYNILLQGCDNYLIANQAFQQREPGTTGYENNDPDAYNDHDGAKTDPATFDRLLEKLVIDGAEIGRTEGTEQFVLYRRGSPF